MDQRRHHCHRVELEIIRMEVLAFQDIEIVALPRDVFLHQDEAHLGGTDGRSVVIKFDHEFLLPAAIVCLGYSCCMPYSRMVAATSSTVCLRTLSTSAGEDETGIEPAVSIRV